MKISVISMSKQIPVSDHFVVEETDPFTLLCQVGGGDWKPITELSSQFVESRLTRDEQKILEMYRTWELPPTNGQIAEVVRQMKLWFKSPEYHTVLETYVKQVSDGFHSATETKDTKKETPPTDAQMRTIKDYYDRGILESPEMPKTKEQASKLIAMVKGSEKQGRQKIPITDHFWIYENDPSMLMITIDSKDVSARFSKDSDLYDHTTADERRSLAEYRRTMTNYGNGIIPTDHQAENTIFETFPKLKGLNITGSLIPDQDREKHNEKVARDNHDKEESEKNTALATHGKKIMEVKPGSSLALAKQLGMPDELADLFFTNIDGKPYITNPGLLFLADKKGHGAIQVEDTYNEKARMWEAETKIYPILTAQMLEAIAKLNPEIQAKALDEVTRPTIGKGTAGESNVKNSRMLYFLREMAQTRSQNRALRPYTGYGYTSAEEMPTATIEGETQ